MSADRLREAARLMRERAEAATPSPWQTFEQHGRDHTDEGWSQIGVKNPGHDVALTYPIGFENDYPEPDAEHIASWHPAVTLAVALLLDNEAALIESAAERPDLHMPPNVARCNLLAGIADAYLGSES